jgi:hypothetical protein
MPTAMNGTDRPETPSWAEYMPPPISPNALAVVESSYMEPHSVAPEPAIPEHGKTPLTLSIRQVPAESRILITDDNAINRKVVSHLLHMSVCY